MSISITSIAVAGDEIAIEFWHNRAEGANYDVLLSSVDAFNTTIGAENGIHVNETYIGSYNAIIKALETAVAEGNPIPQVIVAGNSHVGYLLDRNLLIDMQSFADATSFNRNNLYSPFLQIYGNENSSLYSLPYIRSVPLFYYNKTMADAKGLTPSNSIGNGMEGFCKGLHEINSVSGEVDIYGFEMVNDFSFYQVANIYQLGSQIVNEDGTASPALEDGTISKILSDWQSWINEGWCRTYDEKSATNAMINRFYNGEVASFVSSSGSLSNVLANADFEVGVLPYISYGPAVSQIGGGNLCLVGNTNIEEQISASWTFVEFLMNDEMVVANAIGSGYLPITISSGKDTSMSEFWSKNPLYKVAFSQLGTARCQEVPYFSFMNDLYNIYTKAVHELILHRNITVEQAIEMIEEQTFSLLSTGM